MNGEKIDVVKLEVAKIRQKYGVEQGAPKDLLASLASDGQQREITVHPITDCPPYEYEIEDGGRRLACAQKLNWTYINARIVPFDDVLSHRRTLASNIASHNLIQEARAIAELGGLDAETPGYTKGQREARLRLLNLTEDFQSMLDQQIITLATAKELARLTPADQEKAWGLATTTAIAENKGRVTSKIVRLAAKRVYGQSVGQQALAMPSNVMVAQSKPGSNGSASALSASLRQFMLEHEEEWLAKAFESALEALDGMV